MQTNFSARIRNVLLGIILIGVVLFPGPVIGNRVSGTNIQDVTSSQPDINGTVSTLTDSTGLLILPDGNKVEQQAVYLPKSRSTKARIPGPVYELGCSAVSGEIISKGLDRGGKYEKCKCQSSSPVETMGSEIFAGVSCSESTTVWVNMNSYPNLYTGPTNGGVMPEDNSLWPTWTDSAGDAYPNNPLLASHMGVDGRTTRGTIDDYWVSYESAALDPYITGGWLPHIWGDAIGDFMYTSQSEFENIDGNTKFYNNPVHPAGQYTCEMSSSNSQADGALGIKQFYQARGYAVGACYNQQTDNVIAGGFSFAQFKAEIDAGWPVLIGIDGHSVVGVGYDATTHMVYIFNGWDNDIHAMQWPDNCYDGHCSVSYKYPDTAPYTYVMALQSVSVVHIVPGTPKLYTITGNAGVANAIIAYTGGNTTTDSNGNYSFTVSENWFGTVKPSKSGSSFTPAQRNYANIKANVVAQNYNSVNLLQDPSFEDGTTTNHYWTGTSISFGTPLCNAANCGPTVYARTGSVWAWFGGVSGNEIATLWQMVTIPSGSASLDFYLWIPDARAGSDANDMFAVKVDGTSLFTANAAQLEYYYSAYRPINVNISAYADGKPHKIEFSAVTTAQVVSFHVDDVSINSTPQTIPPDSFNKSSPPDGAINQPTNPTLTWSNSANLTSYQYCYDKTNSCSNWTDNGIATSVTLSGLEYNTTYYWHVRAVNNYGVTYSNGSPTAFWSFKTIPEVVIPTPLSGPPLPVMTSQILNAGSLVNETGTKSGSIPSLNVQDQAGTADNPASYVSFQTPEGSYSGYLSFTLPQGAEARTISSMLLQVNFKRPATNQIWTWSVYDPSSGMWINLGNSVGTMAGQWQSLVLRIPQPWRFVSPTNEIRIQLRSNNNNGDLKIDYEALHITYLSVPDTIVVPPVNTRRPGGF